MAGDLAVIKRDHNRDHLLNRIARLEEQVARLERALASRAKIEGAGTTGATEQAWMEYIDPDGNAGYIRVYAAQ